MCDIFQKITLSGLFSLISKKRSKIALSRSLSMIVIYSNDFFKRSTRVSSLWILLYSLIILLEIFDLPCTYTRNFPKFVNIADVIVIFSHWVSGLDYAAWITVLFGDESMVKLLKVSFLLTAFCKPSSENLMPSSGNCAHMQLISLTQKQLNVIKNLKCTGKYHTKIKLRCFTSLIYILVTYTTCI